MLKEEQKFNRKRLKEARLIRGLTIGELADKIGVSKQAVSQYELGENVPKSETLLAIVSVLGFSRSFFFKDYNEQVIGNTFFRANATASKKTKEIQFYKSILAGYIFDYLERLIEFPKLNLPDVSAMNIEDWDNESIELLAAKLREYWSLGDKPIHNIVNLMERNGIIVFNISMDSQKVDAFCQHRQGRPFIFLGNDKQSGARRQFDGGHELGHDLMHRHIHNQDVLTREEFKKIESQSNRFSSAFLLPREAFAKTVTSTTLAHFIELKHYWRVSIAAMLHRCLDLDIISESRYTSLMKQMSAKRMRTIEPLDDVLPIPEPTVMKKSIKMLLENNVKNELQIVQEIGIPQKFIEMLCNLEEGTLIHKEAEPMLRLVVNNATALTT
ncbi:helix-turn-helix domain-containing protein [Paenibacillus elgii]|uniref:helix-turn-helix domain-containing protein n=1 Tax=Paenibacillus elgii TaxID=189691 RepID=UPI00203F88A0|nr:XRE family transcriptional regulator [Paenibacillus elgii]MCM3271137.1 XRE family transcriptional regulator [Paenibacillus elgii]